MSDPRFPELRPGLRLVALLIAQDQTAAQIALALNITLGTAYEYRCKICRELGVNGPAGVTAIAFRRGYLA